MTDRKTELRFFAVPDWDEEQEYLRQQHREGWRFVRLGGIGAYHFERCVPEDVVYQLDYNQEGSAHQREYRQMFRDCGWEYLGEYFGYSYFRKPAGDWGGEEIFCDDQSRLDMMRRVFRGKIIPLILLFVSLVLNPLWLSYALLERAGILLVPALAVVLYVYSFAKFGYRYWQLWKRVNK